MNPDLQIIAGNWKMNLTLSQGREFLAALRGLLATGAVRRRLMLAPNFTLLSGLAAACRELGVVLAAQNCAAAPAGAYTGETSTAMLRDVGVEYVIVGHSERRRLFGEDDATLRAKARAVVESGMTPIFCVGETLEQRQAQEALRVVMRQLEFGLEGYPAERLVVAYEPVWAIGTGRTATPEDARKMHTAIRNFLVRRFSFGSEVPILYGGSAKPDNAAALLAEPEIGGLLVGGASLAAESFWRIARA